jgi:hypothetical protein
VNSANSTRCKHFNPCFACSDHGCGNCRCSEPATGKLQREISSRAFGDLSVVSTLCQPLNICVAGSNAQLVIRNEYGSRDGAVGAHLVLNLQSRLDVLWIGHSVRNDGGF